MKRQSREPVIDSESPEWTAEKFKRAKTFKECSPVVQRALLGLKSKPKAVSVEIDPAVAKKLNATGKALQAKVNKALKEWAKDHPPKKAKKRA